MAWQRPLRAFAVIAALAAGGGCSKCLHVSTTEPHPLAAVEGAAADAQALPESSRLHIDVKDVELPRTFKLRNSAYFSVVSRDRLRFHVTVVHKWEEIADVKSWRVHLEDDRGHVFYPEAKERAKNEFTTRMWDSEQRSAVRDAYGDIVKVRNDAYRYSAPLASVDLFKGQGDYVFHAEDIFSPEIESLTLVMSNAKSGIEYQFTWHFV